MILGGREAWRLVLARRGWEMPPEAWDSGQGAIHLVWAEVLANVQLSSFLMASRPFVVT